MYRSPGELTTYVRYHIADLADERRACSPITQSSDAPARILTQMQRRLGMGLIRLGHALAGYDSVRRLPTPSARSATWGPSS
jgi:hypothetical protein